MQRDLQITLRDITPSPALDQHIRDRAQRLERHCPQLMGCHVTVGTPHRHKSHGRHFQVRIELGMPGNHLVVTRDPEARRAHEDAHAAVEDAFDHAERVLHGHIARRRSA